jgi:hypothetical protein
VHPIQGDELRALRPLVDSRIRTVTPTPQADSLVDPLMVADVDVGGRPSKTVPRPRTNRPILPAPAIAEGPHGQTLPRHIIDVVTLLDAFIHDSPITACKPPLSTTSPSRERWACGQRTTGIVRTF